MTLAETGTETVTTLSVLLWVALPYVAAVVFILGHVWRYRYDKFGWTTRSSQVYENRLLRLGSPMFHLGILLVLLGHIVGLFIPRSWLTSIGVSEHVYHLGATWIGSFAAVLTIAGLAILIYRRRTVGPVFLATTTMDKVMYVALGGTILFGAAATFMLQVFGSGYEYRGTISPWIRSLFALQPEPELMANVPFLFQVHVLFGTALFILWPFTRLVHVFSAPVGYLVRPYIVYRSRDEQRGTRARKRGWEEIKPPDPEKLRRL